MTLLPNAMNSMIALMFALGAVLAYASLRRIPEDTACTVHRFGRYARTLMPGLRFTLPFIDKIAHQVRLVGHQIDLAPQPLQHGQAARAAVYYQILDPERAGEALDEVDALVEREAQVRLAALTHAAAMPMDGITLDRLLRTELNRRFDPLGLRITRCQVQLAQAA